MANVRGHVVEFFYDISCPFAYIASTRIEALAARTGATIIWRPTLLGGIYRATDAPQGAAGSASDVFNPTKKTVSSRSFERTIRRYNLPYSPPPRHPIKTTAALRLLYHVENAQRAQLSKSLFRAYWAEGRDVSDRSTLIDAVRRARVSGAEKLVQAIEKGNFEGQEQRNALEKATNDAIERGSPGVPGFWIPDEVWIDKLGERRKGRLYWGQDRMHFVEAVLETLNRGKNGDSLQTLNFPLQSLMPMVTRKGIPDDEEVKMQFWYDFSSPWAFLGWTQLARLQRRFGNRLHVEMKPFLLGILFREIGAPDVPSLAISEQKRNYSNLDHSDWVRWWDAISAQSGQGNRKLGFRYPDVFPIRTPTVLRAALVEPKLIDVLFPACWVNNKNVAKDEVLKQVIDDAGYDGAQILKRANEQDIKTKLRQCTKEAKDEGLCGVPSYRIYRRKRGQDDKDWRQSGDLVWGQDEINVVEDMIAGWDGSGLADVQSRENRSKL